MTKTNNSSEYGPFPLYFGPIFQLAQIFFGDSPSIIEWDKIVTEIKNKTF